MQPRQNPRVAFCSLNFSDGAPRHDTQHTHGRNGALEDTLLMSKGLGSQSPPWHDTHQTHGGNEASEDILLMSKGLGSWKSSGGLTGRTGATSSVTSVF